MCFESWICASKYILYALTQIPFLLNLSVIVQTVHLSWSLGNYCIWLAKPKVLFSALEYDFILELVILCLVYMTYMFSYYSQKLYPALTDSVFSGAELLLICHHISMQAFRTHCKCGGKNFWVMPKPILKILPLKWTKNI